MVAIIVQLLLLQAASAGFACAAMDDIRDGGVTVICHGDGSSLAGNPPQDRQSHDCCIDCLCAIGCGHPPSILAASVDRGLAVAPHSPRAGILSWPLAVDALGPRGPPSGLAYKRGPPLSV